METHHREVRVAVRLAVGFGAILAMMLLLSVLSIFKVNAIDASLQKISEVNNVKQRYAINFRGSVHDRAIALRDVTLEGDDQIAALNAQIDKLNRDYQNSAQPLDALFSASAAVITPEERAWLAKIKQAERRTMPLIEQIIAARRNGDLDGARQTMLSQAKPALVEWLAVINGFIDQQEKMTNAESEDARKAAHNFQNLTLLLLLIAVVISVLVAWRVSQYLLRALGAEPSEVTALAHAVDRGELYHEAVLRQNDNHSIMATERTDAALRPQAVRLTSSTLQRLA
eukprot:gene5612-5490_t